MPKTPKTQYRTAVSDHMGLLLNSFPNGLKIYGNDEFMKYVYKGDIVLIPNRGGYFVDGDLIYFTLDYKTINKHNINTKETTHVCTFQDKVLGMFGCKVIRVGEHMLFHFVCSIRDFTGRIIIMKDTEDNKLFNSFRIVETNEFHLVVAEVYATECEDRTKREYNVIIHIFIAPHFNKVYEQQFISVAAYSTFRVDPEGYSKNVNYASDCVDKRLKSMYVFIDMNRFVIDGDVIAILNASADIPECPICVTNIYTEPKLKFTCTHPEPVCVVCNMKVNRCPLCRNTELAKN